MHGPGEDDDDIEHHDYFQLSSGYFGYMIMMMMKMSVMLDILI